MSGSDDEGTGKHSLITISDLAGISAPAKELVKNIARGIGELATVQMIRSRSAATAKAIGEVSTALEKLGLKATGAEIDLSDRTMARVLYRESKRQENLDRVTALSVEIVDEEAQKIDWRPGQSDVDEDWIARFIHCAQDVSNEQMQEVWARVFARQTVRSGAFSIRSLDTLSKMSHNDAQAFQRVALVAYELPDQAGILLPAERNDEILQRFGNFVSWNDTSLMETFGIIFSDGMLRNLRVEQADKEIDIFIAGRRFMVSRKEGEDKFDFGPHHRITPLGRELIALIDRTPQDEYIQLIREGLEASRYVLREVGQLA